MFAYIVTIAVSAGAGMLWGAKHPDQPVADFCNTVKQGFMQAWDRLHHNDQPPPPPASGAAEA